MRPVGGEPFRLSERGRGRIESKWSIWNTDYRRDSFRSHLLTALAHGDALYLRGSHTGRGARAEYPGTAPLSSELWHHTAYPVGAGSHLGSTLNPGRAVLTLGVFRRSRSVAYIRADASPSEVLAEAMVAAERKSVKPNCDRRAAIHLPSRSSGVRRPRITVRCSQRQCRACPPVSPGARCSSSRFTHRVGLSVRDGGSPRTGGVRVCRYCVGIR